MLHKRRATPWLNDCCILYPRLLNN
jgi:hypothetical protein